MHRSPDPLKVYEHAIMSRDRGLADALAQRLFPWRRSTVDPHAAPTSHAAQAVTRLLTLLLPRGRQDPD